MRYLRFASVLILLTPLSYIIKQGKSLNGQILNKSPIFEKQINKNNQTMIMKNKIIALALSLLVGMIMSLDVEAHARATI